MPTFTFVRHAEALHNADYHKRGTDAYYDIANRDAPLTPTGIDQTQKEMSAYAGKTYDAIYCSPLQRCRQTLLGIYPDAKNLPVILDDRLMEPQGDHLCNWRLDRDGVKCYVPTYWELTAVSYTNPGAPPHINERMSDFRARIREWTDDIVTRHSDDARILVVTHYMWSLHWFDIHQDEAVYLPNCKGMTTVWPRKKLTLQKALPHRSDDDYIQLR